MDVKLEDEQTTDKQSSDSIDVDESEEVSDKEYEAPPVSAVESRDFDFDDLYVNAPSPRSSGILDIPDRSSAYSKFQEISEEQAATWRAQPEREEDSGMNLAQKAKAMSEKVTRNFHHWLEEFSGQENAIFTEEELASLFDYKFQNVVLSSMSLQQKEMPHVPKSVALECGLPEKEYFQGVREELRRDCAAETKVPRIRAFGKHLPQFPPLRFVPPHNRVCETWIHYSNVPKDLQSMKNVWHDITNLSATKKFCQWLQDQDEFRVPPAPYLINKGLTPPAIAWRQRMQSLVKSKLFSSNIRNEFSSNDNMATTMSFH